MEQKADYMRFIGNDSCLMEQDVDRVNETERYRKYAEAIKELNEKKGEDADA